MLCGQCGARDELGRVHDRRVIPVMIVAATRDQKGCERVTEGPEAGLAPPGESDEVERLQVTRTTEEGACLPT